MWICKQCGENCDDQFDTCWKCSTVREAGPPPPAPAEKRWYLTFQSYRGTLATWDELFGAAARFASDLGPERVLNISHSADEDDGVVTVWYWTLDQAETGKISGV